MHAKVVHTLNLEALTQQLTDTTRLKPWQGTGIALPWTVELTTLPADQAALDVVHWKMVTLVDLGETWMALEDMVLIAITLQGGKLVTGFALGQFTLSSYIVFFKPWYWCEVFTNFSDYWSLPENLVVRSFLSITFFSSTTQIRDFA